VTSRRVWAVIAGYVVVLVFALTAGVALRLGADRSTAIAAGILLAAPIVVGLVGNRITGVKAFSVEISLAEVSVPVEGDFSRAVMEVSEMQGSAAPELSQFVQSAIEGGTKVIRLNLRNDDYWWSTRVFLLGALATDYTDVEAIVFVRGGEQRLLVGVATPRSVRERLSEQFPDYETTYRKIKAELDAGPAISEVSEILSYRWTQGFDPSEEAVKVTARTEDLKSWLKGDLDQDSLPYGPLTPLLRYRVIERRPRFTALTDGPRMAAVVDRDELALRTTRSYLEQRLS
jgi:hypothetical protein